MSRERVFQISLSLLLVGGLFFSLPLTKQYEEFSRLLAIACIAIAAFLQFGRILPSSLKLDRSSAMLFVIAGLFWFWMGLTIFWSVAPHVSVIAFGTFSLLILSFYTTAFLKDRPAEHHVAIGAGLILSALGLWALIQYFFLPDMFVTRGVRHPFNNPNHYAALLSLGVFGALGYMQHAGKRLARNAATVVVMLCLGGIVVIASKAVMLALPAGLAVFLYLTRDYLKNCRRQILAIALFILTLVMATALMPDTHAAPAERMANFLGDDRSSLINRLDIWKATLAIIASHPFLGTGFGTFYLFYPEYRLDTELSSGGLMAHSDPLQFWAEAGILSVILFYAFLVFVVLRMIRSGKTNDPLTAALFCGLGVMLVHAHVSFNLYAAPLLCLSGLMLGAWFSRTATQEPVIMLEVSPAFSRVGLGAILLAFLFMLQGVLTSEYNTGVARHALLKGDMKTFQHAVNKADRAGFGLNGQAYLYAASIPVDILGNSAAPVPLSDRGALTRQAQGLLDRAERVNNRMGAIPLYRAKLALLSGRDQDAEEYLKEALKINSMNLEARIILYRMYDSADRKEEAYGVLRQGLHWPYRPYDRTALAYYGMVSLLALMHGEAEDREKALRETKRRSDRLNNKN